MSTEQAIALTKNGKRSKTLQATIFGPNLGELEVDESLPFLEPLLELPATRISPAGQAGYSERDWDADQRGLAGCRGRLQFPAGLLPRIQRTLAGDERSHN